MDFQTLHTMNSSGAVFKLDKDRSKNDGRSRIRMLLRSEALSIDDLMIKLNNTNRVSVYNSVRRYEKKGLIVAFNVKGKVVYADKEVAKNFGLL
jgi:hypothetical protein